jgi:hypothetical protein
MARTDRNFDEKNTSNINLNVNSVKSDEIKS